MKKPLFRRQEQYPQSEYSPDDYINGGAIEQLRELGQDDEADAVLAILSYPPDIGYAADPADILEMAEELGIDI